MEGRAEHPQEGRQGSGLGGRGHEGRDGGGSPLVSVGRPHVEGHRGHLEGHAHQHHEHPGEDQQAAGSGGQGQGPVEVSQVGGGATGSAVEQADAIDEDAAGEGAQQEVLHARFHAGGAVPQVGHQDIDADGHQLDAEVDRHQVRGPAQEEHPREAEENQGVVLHGLLLEAVQQAHAQGHGPGDTQDAEQLEAPGEAVHAVHAGEALAIRGLEDPEGGDGQDHQGDGRPAVLLIPREGEIEGPQHEGGHGHQEELGVDQVRISEERIQQPLREGGH